MFIFLIALLIKSGKDSTPDHVELRLISQDEDESKALELEGNFVSLYFVVN